MKRKSDCEPVIRNLISDWISQPEQQALGPSTLSFGEFHSWLSAAGYAHYLDFRSTAGTRYDAEMWFDEMTGQTGFR